MVMTRICSPIQLLGTCSSATIVLPARVVSACISYLTQPCCARQKPSSLPWRVDRCESTGSEDYPTTTGAFDTTYNGGNTDAFVTKLNAAGSALAYSTFLGGTGGFQELDQGWDIAVDGSGRAYVAGGTDSPDFPTTTGAFDTTYNGGNADAFVTKLNAAGSALAYSTFLGGTGDEEGRGIAVDGSGRAYVAGGTDSTDYPTTSGAFDTSLNGGRDAFVTKLPIG